MHQLIPIYVLYSILFALLKTFKKQKSYTIIQCRYWSYLCYSIFHKGFLINQWNNAHVWQASLTNILCKSEEHNVSTSCIYLAQQEKKNGLTNCLAIIPSILKSCNLRRTKNVPVFFLLYYAFTNVLFVTLNL